MAIHRGFFASIGEADHEVVDLLHRALARLGDVDRPERARLLAILASELTFTESVERRTELSDHAIAVARRTGDDGCIAAVMVGRCQALWIPGTHTERLSITEELSTLARQLADPYLEFWAAYYRNAALIEGGNGAGAAVEIARCAELAQVAGQATTSWVDLFTRAGYEYGRGDLERAEELITQSLEAGQRAGYQDAVFLYGVTLFTIRREQARLEEIFDLIRVAVDESQLRGIAVMLGVACADTGRDDEAEAILDTVAADDFDDIPPSQIRASILWGAATLATHLRDEARAAQLLSLLEPWPDLLIYQGLITFGPAAGILGELSALVGRRDDAERYFAQAIEVTSRAGAATLLAQVRTAWARALLDGGGPDDAARARDLLDQAGAEAERFGLTAIADQVRALIERLEAGGKEPQG